MHTYEQGYISNLNTEIIGVKTNNANGITTIGSRPPPFIR